MIILDDSVLCVIPARGGSKRIPRKNIIDFKGKPLISYSIDAAKASGVFDTIMVSTDDEDIAQIAKSYGADIPFYRSKDTSNDHTGIADVILEVIDNYRKQGKEFKYVACILATAPLIQPSKIKQAYEMLLNNADADSVCPVEVFSYPPQRCLVIRDEKLEMLYPENYFARSQDLEKYYHDCGQFFMFKTYALERDRKLYTQNAIPIIIDSMESQDIDNYEDLKLAEVKYDLLFKRSEMQ